MSVFYGTMTTKGQTTVPAEVRELLNLKPGDKISYLVDGDTVVIKAKNRRAVEAIGDYLGEKHGRILDGRDRHERSSEGDAG